MTSRKKQIDAIIAQLCEHFPQCFAMFQHRRRSLKIGIYADIVAALGDQIDRKLLGASLRTYVSAFGYLQSQTAGAVRIDLDGNVCGTVTEDEAVMPKKAGRYQSNLRQEKTGTVSQAATARAGSQATARTAATCVKRDSLNALRAAALRRKAMA
jgi:ProP effector